MKASQLKNFGMINPAPNANSVSSLRVLGHKSTDNEGDANQMHSGVMQSFLGVHDMLDCPQSNLTGIIDFLSNKGFERESELSYETSELSCDSDDCSTNPSFASDEDSHYTFEDYSEYSEVMTGSSPWDTMPWQENQAMKLCTDSEDQSERSIVQKVRVFSVPLESAWSRRSPRKPTRQHSIESLAAKEEVLPHKPLASSPRQLTRQQRAQAFCGKEEVLPIKPPTSLPRKSKRQQRLQVSGGKEGVLPSKPPTRPVRQTSIESQGDEQLASTGVCEKEKALHAAAPRELIPKKPMRKQSMDMARTTPAETTILCGKIRHPQIYFGAEGKCSETSSDTSFASSADPKCVVDSKIDSHRELADRIRLILGNKPTTLTIGQKRRSNIISSNAA